MPNPHYIKVPRGEDLSPDTQQEPASISEPMKNWLRQVPKDMPWHSLDSFAVSDTQDNSEANVAPSNAPATQGTTLILDLIPEFDSEVWFAALDIGSSLAPIPMAITYVRAGMRRMVRRSVLFLETYRVNWGSSQLSKKYGTLYASRHAGEVGKAPEPERGDDRFDQQTNAWLRENHKDMPWNIIDSIVTSSSNTSEPNPNTNASQNPATQGSA
ncbi:unnamed protein product, partial [Fusarium fujikuroi]